MSKESKFQNVKSWKEIQTLVSVEEVLQALRHQEYQKAYRAKYNKRKNLMQKLIMQKVAAGEINLEEIEAELGGQT